MDTIIPAEATATADPYPEGEDGNIADLLPAEVRTLILQLWEVIAELETTATPLYNLVGGDLALRVGAVEVLTAQVKTMAHNRRILADAENRLVELIGLLLDGGKVPVTGIGRVRVSSTPKKRYDGPMILSALSARIADEVVDPTTGEIPPLAAICGQVATAVAKATGSLTPSFTGWRKGVLEEHGIDLPRYVTDTEAGTPRLVIE